MSNIPADINTVEVMQQTARIMAQTACTENHDTKRLVETVMDNRESFISIEFDGTAYLQICINVFKQTALTCKAQHVNTLRGAVKALKPIYQAALREDD